VEPPEGKFIGSLYHNKAYFMQGKTGVLLAMMLDKPLKSL
jgi:hypothetical protein